MDKARIVAVLGASGMGKTHHVQNVLLPELKPDRLLIWDFKHEFDMTPPTFSLLELASKMEAKKWRLIYRPDRGTREFLQEQFELVCELAHEAKNMAIWIEELHFVTTPQRAPMPWAVLTCTGRAGGVVVIGCCQRPAHMDKDFIGNATDVIVFRLPLADDAAAVAKSLPGVTADEIMSLPEHTPIIYRNGARIT